MFYNISYFFFIIKIIVIDLIQLTILYSFLCIYINLLSDLGYLKTASISISIAVCYFIKVVRDFQKVLHFKIVIKFFFIFYTFLQNLT